MPKRLHDALERAARKRGLKGKNKDRFVYGTMYNMKHRRKRAGRRRAR